MGAIVTWARNKFGRITAAIGFVAAGVDYVPSIDALAPLSEPLKDLVGHVWLSRIMVACFALSFARHQQIANRVLRLEEQGGVLPK